MMVYNTQNYCFFGLCPSSGILRAETDPVSETLSSLVFGIPDDERSPKKQ
jgi:hypothetical protein